jgi:hypothetical protein
MKQCVLTKKPGIGKSVGFLNDFGQINFGGLQLAYLFMEDDELHLLQNKSM